jgi:calcium-translocating P-type ATPase
MEPSAVFMTQHRRFFEALRFCENLKVSLDGGTRVLLGDPTEVALFELAESVLGEQPEFPRVDEVPFDSDRRRLSTLHRTPDGMVLFSKGALEVLLPLCTQVDGPGGVAPMTADWRTRFLSEQDRMARGGLRVLAVAFREIAENPQHDQLEQDLTLLGLVGLHDPPRPEVPDAIRKCREAGIRVIMVTGDHPQTAASIARQIDLVQSDSPIVITGEQLRRMSNTQLQLALDAPEVIFARIGSDQKMRIVDVLQKKGETVAVTGDGVNDAPALRQADIGIAMGVTGTDVARETADMVLADDNFASIVAAIEEGRAVFDNIRKFLTYILTSNIPEIVPYLAFVLFRIPLPLPIIQILAVDLGTDMLPALALGTELPDPQVMQRPPRSRQMRLLNGALLARAYLFLGVLEATAAMAAFFFVLVPAGWQYGEMIGRHDPLFAAYREATTACLTSIVVTQIVNVFNCRSDRRSVMSFGLFSNRFILWGIATELVLIALIDYTSLGNLLFGTAPISWRVWLFAVPFALSMLAAEELRKWCLRRVAKDRGTTAGISLRSPG